MSVYHRIRPETANLKEVDYVTGFGMDTSHYGRVCDRRRKLGLPVRDDYKYTWDRRTGFAIDGTPFNNAQHPYHDMALVERETGKRYVVDTVCKHHYFGFYMMLVIREEGSNSHGCIFWENLTCKDPTITDGIAEAHDRFDVINDTNKKANGHEI